MGKILKKISFWLVGGLTFLVLILSLAMVWIYRHPHETWSHIQEKFLPEDLKITWDEMSFKVEHLQRFDFQTELRIQGLLIQKDKPALTLPIESLHLKNSVLLSSAPPKIVLHELLIQSEKTISFIPEPSVEPKKTQNPFQLTQKIFGYLRPIPNWVKIEKLELKVPDVQIGSDPLLMSFVASQGQQIPTSDALSFEWVLHQNQKNPFQLRSQGVFQFSRLGTDQSFLQGSMHLMGRGVRVQQNLKVSHFQDSFVLSTEGPLDYLGGSAKSRFHLKAQPTLQVHLNEDEVLVTLKSDLKGIPGPLVRIDNLKAELRIPFEKNVLWSERASHFHVSAPIEVFFVDTEMRRHLEKSCQCRIPEILRTEMSGQTWMSTLLSESDSEAQVLSMQMSSESVRNKLLSVDLAADFNAWKKGKEWSYQPSLNTRVQIKSFQNFRKILDAKNILIPAPFDVLEGTLLLKAIGPVETSKESFKFPIFISGNLSSLNQKVKFETNTSLRLRSDFKEGFADIKARIADFQIELPPLDPLKGKPRMTLDKRILRSPTALKKRSGKFRMSFAVEVETVQPGAVRLMSEYFKPLMPLTVKIQHSVDQRDSGFIQTEPFDIEYLRRTVRVEKMRIDLSQSEDGILPVDGRFRIQQAGYLIFIEVKGTTDKPNIEMSSDPYLPESEIISVLLYGRTSDQLISADAETAGSVQAAMADRAIGLFGLWAFAATPIQSFSYNPVTKVYTATVSLGGDVTAGIGTNWESATNLALRKRVSKRWVLTAEWTPATQDEDESTRLVLQWERRF